MQIVENGDPDWLHGFKLDDRTEKLYSFPATLVFQFFIYSGLDIFIPHYKSASE